VPRPVGIAYGLPEEDRETEESAGWVRAAATVANARPRDGQRGPDGPAGLLLGPRAPHPGEMYNNSRRNHCALRYYNR